MTDERLNILLIGDSGVGKTSLLTRFIENKFEENYISTLGVEYNKKVIQINNKNVELVIMDTSGQEKFRTIQKSFYQNANGIIFIFDVTNFDSFENIKNYLKDAESFSEDYKSVLIGNKIDLKNSIAVKKENVYERAIFKDIKYFETSAKDNTDKNVEKPFEELAKLILTEGLDNYKKRRENSFHLHKQINENNNENKSCC